MSHGMKYEMVNKRLPGRTPDSLFGRILVATPDFQFSILRMIELILGGVP